MHPAKAECLPFKTRIPTNVSSFSEAFLKKSIHSDRVPQLYLHICVLQSCDRVRKMSISYLRPNKY